MAKRSTQTLVDLSHLRPTYRFVYRDPLDGWDGASALRASVGRAGVLDPVWLVAESLDVVHGHRRVEAAAELGLASVPALMLAGEPEDLFVKAVEVHAGQGDQNLREMARAMEVAVSLGMDQGQVARRLMPALGLEPHPELVRRHLRLLTLPPELLQLLLRKGFSLRRCLPFCDVAPEDARLLASVCQGLGARKIEQTATALREICARDGVALAELVRGLELDPADARGIRRLDARRHPETTGLRQRGDEVAAKLSGGVARVAFDRNFSRDGVELSARLERPEDLDRLVQHLASPGSLQQLRRLLELLQ